MPAQLCRYITTRWVQIYFFSILQLHSITSLSFNFTPYLLSKLAMSATQSNAPAPAWTLTNPFHKTPYPAISPSRPELSQAGKTVLVTGGNSGIGYAIANAFLEASAAKAIVTGRRADATRDAAAALASANPGRAAVGLACDMGDSSAVDALWDSLEAEGTSVDVLVLNAVKVADAKPLLDSGVGEVWASFDANVRAQLQMVERFHRQKGGDVKGPKVRSVGRETAWTDY